MSRLDDLVRETLAAHASEAPSDSSLLADVRARSARRRARTWLTTGAAAAAVVAVIAVLTQVLPLGSRSPAGAPAATDHSTGQMTVFPLPSDGWQPDGPAMAALIVGPFHAARMEDGEVCAWLGKSFRPMLWPDGYQVRLHPVQLIGPQGQVIANEGDNLSTGGGEIPAQGDAPCATAGQPVWLVQGDPPQRATGMMPGGQGTLTGHAYVAGGPAPGARRPVRGTIVVQGRHGEHRVTVGAGGEYRIQLPVGTYTVTMPRSDYGKSSCSVDRHVTVTRGQTVVSDVVCQMR